ncbi:helix-turn-helix transcriptional regulator [Nocardia huaxiensis]|uniref:helix-turn-helix transcriptional regulator n=1 Tax=Nocardia huaxiensis TaxID=2755382 RepID=UPI001E2BD38A|nr:helix-turn-helix transcriptional regulator [Nocardia huaxiensis]UFS99258.1 helix-turn-helix domain-containing protein [Nocardia huaxiensis]
MNEPTLPLPSLGDYIEFHRKRLGLTRKALGQKAFLAARTIQKLERADRSASPCN